MKILSMILIVCCMVSCSEKISQPAASQILNDLTVFYKTDKRPPYKTKLTDLSSPNPAKSKAAGAYIYALFVQLLDDETNGRTQWQRLPDWGGGFRNSARTFRKQLADEFASTATGINALKPALWLIEKDPLTINQQHGITALRKIKSDKANNAFKKILTGPHPNASVTIGVIEEVGERKLTALAPLVLKLHNSYRKAVRDAVRKALPQLKITTPQPAFNPEQAFTPFLEEQLKNISSMVLVTIPENAKWKKFIYLNPDRLRNNKPTTFKIGAWLLSEDKENYDIIDYYANEFELPKKYTKMVPYSLAAEVDDLLKIRKEGLGKFNGKLSRSSALTGQFQPRFISVPELLISAWSFERGDKKSTAALLFPRIDEMADDRWLTWTMRDLIGTPYHQAMLRAFSHDRDYEKTILIADHLSQASFNKYRYQARAKELAKQLKNRKNDFKTFNLPTLNEWNKIKSGMKRSEQIHYLARHLRLLNCIQDGQPGDVHYRDKQADIPIYPLYIKLMNLWDTEKSKKIYNKFYSKHEVINPYNELRKMTLTPDDLYTLIPYITNENFMPTFSYWRTFHPDRTLHRVNWIVEIIINDAAKCKLIDREKYYSLDKTEKNKYFRKLYAWCMANKGKTTKELLFITLQTTQNSHEFIRAAKEAVHKHYLSVLPIMIKRFDYFSNYQDDIVELTFRLNTPDALPSARKWAKYKSAENDDSSTKFRDKTIRFWASLILLKHSSPKQLEGFATLTAILNKDKDLYWYPRAMNTLLSNKNSQVIKSASKILKKKSFYPSWHKQILQRLFLAGSQASLNYCLKKLDSQKDGSSDRKGQRSRECDDFAKIMAKWQLKKFEYDAKAPIAERNKKCTELKKWLIEQFKIIKQGKKPSIKLYPQRQYFSEWQIDAP